MHLELVELLRCPHDHAPSVLVAAADTIANRYVTEGLLGCPQCYAEYPVRGGVTHFAAARPQDASNSVSVDPMRLAAQLGLTAGRSVFALIGYDITTIAAMREIVAARILLFNASGVDGVAFPTERIQNSALAAPLGVATFGDILPLVHGKFDGIAVQAGHSSPRLLEQASAALRSGGRLVADVRSPLPAGVRELVRDDFVWVSERESVASTPVGITRRLSR
ncbi:MAG: hypothetical protein ABJB74_04730 [Gemmatimonas sp.]